VTVKAPAHSGRLYLEAGMFKDHQFWFPTAQPVVTPVKPTLWWSSADMGDVPLHWKRGETLTFTIRTTNTGNEPWPSTGANPVELDVHFTKHRGGADVAASWVTSQVFTLPGNVIPGGTVRVEVSVTAPPSAGLYYVEVQVFKDHQMWIDGWMPVAVTVG
jgi:hypothetical protein